MTLRRICAALVTALLLVFLGGTLPASADSSCNEKVVDTTAKSLLDNKKVEAAVNQLETVGADVYVRAFDKTPGDSIDAYYRSQYSRCSNWQSPDGKTPKGNLILVAFGMDHTSAILYGSNWHNLDSKADSIRSNSLNANLKSGDYTKAVTATLSKLESAIASPAPSSTGTHLSINWGAVGMGVLYIIGGIVLLALLFFVGRHFVYAYSARKEQQRYLQTARDSACRTRTSVTNQYTRVLNTSPLKKAIDLQLQTVNLPQSETKKFESRWNTLQQQLSEANAHYAQASAKGETELLAMQDIEQLQRSESGYAAVGKQLTDVEQGATALWNELNDLNHQLSPDGLQKNVTQLQIALDADLHTLASISAFSTAAYTKRLASLRRRAAQLEESGASDIPADNWDKHQALAQLGTDEQALAADLQSAITDQREIDNAPKELATKLASTRRLVDTSRLSDKQARKFNKQLESLQASIDAFAGSPDRDVEKVRRHKDNLHTSLDNVASACRNERRKKATSSRHHSYSSRSSDDSFGNSLMGGYLGASMASGSHHSSNSSSSNSDFGGGSSGSWGGGGGFDFGGGSSGGW